LSESCFLIDHFLPLVICVFLNLEHLSPIYIVDMIKNNN